MRSSMATNHMGRDTGVPSLFNVVRTPVCALASTAHASSLLRRMLLIGLRPVVVPPSAALVLPSDRRRAPPAAAFSRHVAALRLREALADVLARCGLAGVVVEPGVEAVGALAVGHGAGDGREV